MDIIEQAAKRLEQLRQAGLETPGDAAPEPKVGAGSRVSLDARQADAPAQGNPLFSRSIELDMAGLSAHGIITPDAVRSQLGDELRVLKRPLLNNATGKSAAPIRDANLIMVTSAVPGEGKTHLSANLAISIAMELDHTVLLVDADVARPSMPAVLGFGQEKGLLDMLLDSSLELSQVLLRTNIEKLSILPAGTQHPRATELLASEAMINLLADMANRYSDRIIIFDSPPLLVTTEARALASHMGQVILVVKAESTSHADVRNAVATIENCPVKMLVLNQATGHGDGHGYGYGYGYGYGEGRAGGSDDRKMRGRASG
jgi:protein-tyrosine kinase